MMVERGGDFCRPDEQRDTSTGQSSGREDPGNCSRSCPGRCPGSFTPRVSVSVVTRDLVGGQAQQLTRKLDVERCPARCAARDTDDVVIDVHNVMQARMSVAAHAAAVRMHERASERSPQLPEKRARAVAVKAVTPRSGSERSGEPCTARSASYDVAGERAPE